MFKRLALIGISVMLMANAATALEPAPAEMRNSIDQYVAKRDRTFTWNVAEVIGADGYETVLIDLTSQTWLDATVVDRPGWQHRLILTVPNDLAATNIAFLYISGGSNTAEPRRASSELTRQIALTTRTVVAELRQVPNQPLVFDNDGRPRYEDDLIAYAWTRQLESKQDIWLPRNAMVKSAVRAMDTISAFMDDHRDGSHPIDYFVVGGGSKRGWTTWLTGAMDDRVVAVVPIVIDVLNVEISMAHHFAAYGYYSPSIGDYINHGIIEVAGTPELAAIYDLVDPLRYAKRFDIPQFVVNATGDQFFLPDSSRFYWDQLQRPKYLRYVTNTDHGLGNSDGPESVAAFHFAVTRGKSLPEFEWQYASDSEIDVTFTDVPDKWTLWQATNETFRDFRLETFGAGYSASEISVANLQPNKPYRFKVEAPQKGWKAWLFEATYDIGFVRPIKLTTEVRVTPDSLPYENKPANLAPSLTFVLNQLESTEGLFDAISQLLTERSIGDKLSLVTQGDLTYINFNPLTEPQTAYFQMAAFLRNRFGENLDATIQLESGIGPTLTPPQ